MTLEDTWILALTVPITVGTVMLVLFKIISMVWEYRDRYYGGPSIESILKRIVRKELTTLRAEKNKKDIKFQSVSVE